MRLQDILLMVSIFAGIAVGFFWPNLGKPLEPTVLYLMLFILLMSFMRIDYTQLLRLAPREAGVLAIRTGLKLIILPVALWGVTMLVAPSYALPVLLLSGVSAGVTAPFFAQVLGAKPSLALQLVMATSLLLPITLPALVKLLMGHEIEIPFSHMARLLVIIILVPLVAAALIRRFAPALARGLARWQFPLSITCFFIINVAIFGGYSSFLAEHQVELLSALVVSCFLALAYSGLGWLAGVVLGGGMDGITGAVEMTFINNVLIVVFASQFFGPETPLVAAMYLLPVNALIPVLRWVGARSS